MRLHKLIILPTAVATIIALAQSANATSGRTNSAGCHNSKTAGYHCHGKKTVSKTKAAKAGKGKKR